MNVLTDLHHRDLYYSLHCLFEKRLGCTLYRPEGMDWYTRGYWDMGDCAPYDALHQQFLIHGLGENVVDHRSPPKGDVSYVWNHTHGYFGRSVSMSAFSDMKFDVILPSHPANYECWKKLQRDLQPKATYIAHVGNIFVNPQCDFVIRSISFLGECKKSVLVHQELNQSIYRHVPTSTLTRKITSVTNGYPFSEIYNVYKSAMPDCDFKYFGGAGSPDGVLDLHGVAKQMQLANLGWSTKVMGGLGHSNMGWMLSGRPIVTNMSEHHKIGECALDLFEPGVTCIDIDSGTVDENASIFRSWMHPEEAAKRGGLCVSRFREVINYESEAEKVSKFLSEVL